MKFGLFFMMVCAPLLSHTVIDRIQTDAIGDLYHYVEEGTLVIFDVDTTLIDTVHELGSEPWAEAMVHRYEHDLGLGPVEARAELTPLWNEVLMQAQVRPIHPQVQAAVRRLQRQGVALMGMSDKDPDIAYIRLEHLKACDANLALTAPHPGHVNVHADAPAKMLHGVLFSGVYNHPGDVLVGLLDELRVRPERVILVSSSISLLHDLEHSVIGRGIPFVGVRYIRFEERVRRYRPEIAEVQLNLFNRVLSDEAAAALKPGWSFWPFG